MTFVALWMLYKCGLRVLPCDLLWPFDSCDLGLRLLSCDQCLVALWLLAYSVNCSPLILTIWVPHCGVLHFTFPHIPSLQMSTQYRYWSVFHPSVHSVWKSWLEIFSQKLSVDYSYFFLFWILRIRNSDLQIWNC